MAIGSVVFILMRPASGTYFVVLVVVAFATGWGWPGLMTFTVVNANSATVAASSAITQAGIFAGAGLGPVVLGLVIDATSFQTSWALVSVALLVAAVIVTIVGVRTQQPEPPHPQVWTGAPMTDPAAIESTTKPTAPPPNSS